MTTPDPVPTAGGDPVEQLRRQLGQLAQAVAALHKSTALTVDSITKLDTRISNVETARAGGPGGRPGQARHDPASMRWGALDADVETAAWRVLVGWVGWLVVRYQLHNDLAACWYRHPPLVEELTGLYLAWQAATTGNGPWDAVLRWHEELHRSRARWREWDDETKCRLNHKHTQPETVAWTDTWTTDAQQYGPRALPLPGGETP